MRLKAALLTMCLGLAVIAPSGPAEAARPDARGEARNQAPRGNGAQTPGQRGAASRAQAGRSWGGISCVPYARSVTGMEISGNGRDWWRNAAGRYARGQRPEIGSVLSFPGSGGMSSGHVAVVSRVVNARTIEIDHANWGGPGIRRGTVMQGVRVMDVSDDNSWTRVRVQVGHDSTTFGREYPTHGFIHNRPASAYAEADDFVRPVSFSPRPSAARPGTAPRKPAAQPARIRAAQAR